VPRPRRSSKPSRSAAYERRDAAARAKGYKGYYDYRAHDNGRLPPSAPRLRGEALAQSRGHRSLADLQRAFKPDALLAVSEVERDRRGRFRELTVTLVDPNGREREFTLSGKQLDKAKMREFVGDLTAAGVTVDPYLARLADEPDEEPAEDLPGEFEAA
jgi:hypothetical protein